METDSGKYHHTDEVYFETAKKSIQNALDEGIMSEDDKKLVEKFTIRLKSKVVPSRYAAITSVLCRVRRFFPCDYRSVDDDSLMIAFSEMKYAKKEDGEPYKRNTVSTWMIISKRFITFLVEEGITKVTPKALKNLTTMTADHHTKTEDDVYTAEEIESLITAAKSPKYKAYIGLLYETGARSIEMYNLKWRDITFCDWGLSINLTDTKTDKVRTVPCVTYAKYLYDWMNQYRPGQPEGDNYIFVTARGEPIKYSTVKQAMVRFAQAAGITKPMTLHRFRHTRITHSLRGGMSETICKKAYWGNETTAMIGTYGHLTSQDVRDEVLRMSGVEIPRDVSNDSPKPITCPVCHKVLPPNSKVCTCGKILDEELAQTLEGTIKTLDEFMKKHSEIKLLDLMSKMTK